MENDLILADESLTTTKINKPKIYSKKAVLYFSFFCSPVFGGALISANLWNTRKKSVGFAVLFLSLIYVYLTTFINGELLSLIARTINFNSHFPLACILLEKVIGFIFNFIGAYILTEYVQGNFFQDETNYEKREIWFPLAIAIAIFLFGMAYSYVYFLLLTSH